MSAGPQPNAEPEIAGRRWRDATAELEYAERRGAPAAEVERLASEVIEARVAMFQAGVSSGWQLPEFLQAALDRDRQLLEIQLPDADIGTDAGTDSHSDADSGFAPGAGTAPPAAPTLG